MNCSPEGRLRVAQDASPGYTLNDKPESKQASM